MAKAAKVSYIILIVIDDVRASQFFDLMKQGKLPIISKLAKQGISSQNCITSFPSVTFPSYPNIVTGAYCGFYPIEGSGIPGYHWVARTDPPSQTKKYPFIRNYDNRSHLWKIDDDLGPNCKTIFEQAGEGNYVSVVNLIYKGSHFTIPEGFTTEKIFKTAEDAYKNPEKTLPSKEIPKITVIYVPETDSLMHEKGFDHIEYIQELIKCDKCISSLIKIIKKIGIFEDTAICIMSDHGNYKAENSHDIEPFFTNLGLRQYNPKDGSGDFDANIGGLGFFNFRGDTWHLHPSIGEMREFTPTGTGASKIDIINTLWKIPGTKLMYYRNDNNKPDRGIILLEKKNEKTGEIIKGKIEYENHGKLQKTKYTYDKEDLFEYEKNEFSNVILDNKFHNIDEWLAATNGFDFPMFIDLLPRYFKNPRSCDIMTSTNGEYVFNFEHGKTVSHKLYSHDIAQKNSMTVPLVIGGSSNIPNLNIPYCKTIDIVPSLLDLLGIKADKTVVGRSILK
jgi:hypothetical protein